MLETGHRDPRRPDARRMCRADRGSHGPGRERDADQPRRQDTLQHLPADDLTSRRDRAFDPAARPARLSDRPLHVPHPIESTPRRCYFANSGNAGSFATSRGSCWMITLALRFFAAFRKRSREESESARFVFHVGTPSLR